jgi:hypothetical protein
MNADEERANAYLKIRVDPCSSGASAVRGVVCDARHCKGAGAPGLLVFKQSSLWLEEERV